MNSLIGLGATTSFAAGAASALNPALGLEATFMEEPVMLLAFVLLGRALEARARLKASGEHHFYTHDVELKLDEACLILTQVTKGIMQCLLILILDLMEWPAALHCSRPCGK